MRRQETFLRWVRAVASLMPAAWQIDARTLKRDRKLSDGRHSQERVPRWFRSVIPGSDAHVIETLKIPGEHLYVMKQRECYELRI